MISEMIAFIGEDLVGNNHMRRHHSSDAAKTSATSRQQEELRTEPSLELN